MSAKIIKFSAKTITNSCGSKTIESELVMSDGVTVIASVPSGRSTGTGEAKILSPEIAVKMVNNIISDKLNGIEISDIYAFDEQLKQIDGTSDKHYLGANSILSCSICATRYLAVKSGLPIWKYISNICSQDAGIPKPMMVMIEGGNHSIYGGIKWQEFLLNSDDINQGLRYLKLLKNHLEENNIPYTMGLEGGYGIDLDISEQGLALFLNIFNEIGDDNSFSLDIAATRGASVDLSNIIALAKNKIISIEDPAGENDWNRWREINRICGDKVKIIGDDLTVTNVKRLNKALTVNACSGVIIKPIQIGSVSETLDFVKLAKSNKLICIVSHRAEETTDDFIADLAVGIDADYLKSGAPTQPYRLAKYTRLNNIKKEFKEQYGK